MNLAILYLLSSGAALFSQVQSGTIVGTVTDQAGAATAGAKVTLVNDGTRFTRVVATNDSGQYVATSVPTGAYTITAELQGFQKLVRSGLQLTAADTLTVDLQLRIGDVQETVEVKETAPLLQSQTAAVSSLVTNQQMIEMPLNGRTFTALLKLSPGAYTGSSGNLATSQYAIRGDVNISVNGSSAQNNTYLIDGMVNRNLWLSTLVMVPTVDSIQEVRMMTSNYTAEYGAAAGAITVVQTKSGTNQLHGSLYEFLRNNALDANTFFNNRAGVAKPAFNRNEFGGTIGGPVRKDKTFFFGDYQGIRLRQPRTVISTIPTLAQRQWVTTGDFSGLNTTIFDPTNVANGARVAFPGNRIPAARLDPAALKLTGFLPAPTNSGATRNFVFNPAISQRTDQFDVRLDHNLGASDRVFFKYSYDDTLLITPGNVPAPANAGVPISQFLSSDGTDTGTETPLKNWSVTFNYVKVVSANIVNEVRLGAVRWNQYISPLGNSLATATAVGIPGVNINDKSGGLPSFAITGFRNIGDASTYPENSQTVSFQYEDVLTVVRNAHTFKVGGQYVQNRFNGFSAFPTRGTFNFNGQFTRQIGTTVASTALADWAIGAPSDINRNILVGTFGMRFYNLNAFFDDSWRVTNRLTLNYGVRYELLTPPYEVYDRWSNFNVSTAQLEIAGRDGASRRLRNLDTNNLAPRLGLTYMLTSDRRTVLRAGFGSSFVEAGQGGGQLYKNLPFFFSNVLATDQNAPPPRRLSQGLDAPVAPDLNNKAQLSGGNPNAWDYGLKSTQTMQWSMGVQREIVQDLLVDVSYVGTRTLGLISNVNLNQSAPGPGAQGPRRPFFAVNPGVTNVTYRTNYGAAKYHSLQTRVERRMRSGLTMSLSYTWSHFLANGGNINGGGNAPPQDARCYRCEWGSMPEDRRHNAVFNHVWELPFGKGKPWASGGAAAAILGGWSINGIWSMSTGEHFTPSLAAAVSNSAGGGGDRPNRLRDGNLAKDQRTIDRWFDLAAFAPAAQFSFGNAGRGILVGPGDFNVDAGIHRQFAIKERYKLTFRWEMFNAFNRANFGNPNAAIGNAQAGQISGTAPARIQQAALKLSF
ncbi:MAG: carboxypeptidase regulatory-like domain-containing protein [Bryobacteraceae bacterium]|nr:carboxypeptidase regulatory-like domain-containing protein [Bryobacteraceae bacterium]